MKQVTKEVRNGLKFTVNAPETAEEFDKLAGRVGAAIESANDDIFYRQVLRDGWNLLAARLAKEYSITRKTKDHPEGKTYQEGPRKGQVIQVDSESSPQYVDRVAAELKVDVLTFQSFIDELQNSVGSPDNKEMYGLSDDDMGQPLLTFDPTTQKRAPKQNEPTKAHIEIAKQLLAQGPKKLKVTLKNIEGLIGRPVELAGPDDPNAETINNRALALAVKEYEKAQSRGLLAT